MSTTSRLMVLLVLWLPFRSVAQCNFTFTTTLTHVTCNGGTNGTISIAATGTSTPFTYQLAEGGAGAWQTANAFSGLAAGTYPVSVKDATGCIKTSYVTITQPNALVVGYTTVDPTCAGSTNGSINITMSGGVQPYSYNWTKNGSAYATTQNVSGLAAANYGLTVTDASGCTASPTIPAQVRPIIMTGYNEDVVADGTGAAASTSSSHALDQPTGYVLYGANYSNSTGTGARGLPASLSFTSVQNAARTYNLAPYSGNNALLLRSSTDAANGGAQTGTFSFQSAYQSPYSSLYVVGTTGSGTGTIDYNVNFSDGTHATGSITFPDWSLAASSASNIRALGGLDRVSRVSPGTFANSTDFNLFEAPITMSVANQSKNVNSVTFTWSGSSNARTSLMAITGYTSTVGGIRINDGPASNITPAVSVASNALNNQFCSGQNITFSASPVNGGSSPTYQWKLNGTNVGSGTATYSTSGLSNGDQVSVVLTPSGGTSCLTATTATSAPVTMTLSSKPVSVSNTISGTTVCNGSPATFTATPVNEGTSPSYQWKVNGVNSGTNSPTFTSSALTNNDQVTVTLTSSIGCAVNNPATSAPVTMSVLPQALPTVSITSIPGVTFLSNVTNAGLSASYQWYKNGAPISGATLPTYYTLSPSIGDIFSLKMTSSYMCATAPLAMSNYVTVTSVTLPVTFASFDVSLVKNTAVLAWRTAYEWNNAFFLVQRARGTNVFATVGRVNSTNRSLGSAYTFNDPNLSAGEYQYRLVQQDNDGRQRFSSLLTVRVRDNSAGQHIVTKGGEWVINDDDAISYQLSDLVGNVIRSGSLGDNRRIVQPSASGIYILTVRTSHTMYSERVFK